MKKWSEIKQATLDKLFMSDTEAEQQNYLKKFEYLANECLNHIANRVKPNICKYVFTVVTDEKELVGDDIFMISDDIKMPDNFISFADIINYKDGEPDPVIVYLTYNTIKVTSPGKYSIYYNGEWETIKNNSETLNIDSSVLNCLPTYIASQLLAQDDIQRSTILKNEFELLLAGLDTTTMYESNHYKSTGGWY